VPSKRLLYIYSFVAFIIITCAYSTGIYGPFVSCGATHKQDTIDPEQPHAIAPVVLSDSSSRFYDDFTTSPDGYDPDLWTLETYGENDFSWDGDTVVGLTAWGHGYRTLVSTQDFSSSMRATCRAKWADSNSLPAFGWTDVIPDAWNYHPTAGENGVWVEFNWPEARRLSLYAQKDGVRSYQTITIDDYSVYHNYEIIWAPGKASLIVDNQERASLTTNIPEVSLPFKVLVTAWAGDAQGQWLYVDYVDIAPIAWSDDFNDGDYDGWDVDLGGWSAADNIMRATASDWNAVHHSSTVSNGTWSFDVYHMGSDGIEVWFICNTLGGPYNMATDGYQVALDQSRGAFELWKRTGYDPDISTKIDSYSIPGGPEGWWHIAVTRDSEGRIRAYLNGTLRLEAVDTLFNTSSYFCLNTFNTQAVDNIVVNTEVTPPLAIISGTVVEEISLEPIVDVTIELYDNHDGLLQTTTTEMDGTYEFYGLEEGEEYNVSMVVPPGAITHDLKKKPASSGDIVNFTIYWRRLEIQLTGEFDYLENEPIKIRLTALVVDADSREIASGAAVRMAIYGPTGTSPVLEDIMQERLSGVYVYTTPKTIEQYNLDKGIYLVHVNVFYSRGPSYYGIVEFHIDPPAHVNSQDSATLVTIACVGLAGICAFAAGWRLRERRAGSG